MSEDHQKGEWWIDETGGTEYADGDVGDFNHEAVVIGKLNRDILAHFGIDVDEGGISNYEDEIKQSLIDDDRLTEDELHEWDFGRGPSEVLVKKLLEDHAFGDQKQTEEAVYIAYGSATRDARDYAMKYWRWKVMKTAGKYIEIQTWHLKPDDLQIIVKGIWDIMDDGGSDEDDDATVGEDGYPGPRVNVTVQASGKRFSDIPLAVLERNMPQMLHNYQSGVHVGYTESINEDFHHSHKEYRLYEGNRHIVAVFEDNSRLKFEVHFRNNRGEDKDKWRRKAFTKWKSLASEIHNDVQLTEVGNPVQKSWKDSFKEAMDHPELKEFIRKNSHQKVYPDKGYPASVQGKPQACIDPMNFTQRG